MTELPPLLVDGPAIARELGLHPQSIRRWASQGLLERKGTDRQGRALYDYDEVAQLAATRRRAAGVDSATVHGA